MHIVIIGNSVVIKYQMLKFLNKLRFLHFYFNRDGSYGALSHFSLRHIYMLYLESKLK